MYWTPCVVCRKSFRIQRRTAKYCSNKCKMKARNQKKNDHFDIMKTRERIESDIRFLANNDIEYLDILKALIEELQLRQSNKSAKVVKS